MLDLSIVIVNYNVKYFIEQAIQSILYSNTILAYEIIVVDNNSSDGSVELIRKKYPKVKLIANTVNYGFSTANNQGFKIASGRYTLILNPDTLLQEATLDLCVNHLDQHEEVGALGLRMIDGAGNFLKESKRGFPHPKVALYKSSGIYKIFPKSKKINAYYQGHIDEFETAEVDVLSGAFMMVRSDLLYRVGGFDEDYFMYGEDIDLSYKIQKAGFKNHYLGEASIIHYKGESTKKSSLNYVKVFYKAMIIFAKKHIETNSTLFIFALNMAIYAMGSMTVIKNVLKAIWLPISEITLSIILTLIFQKFWASYHFGDPNYYVNSPIVFNLIIYSLIFLLSMFLHGAYDKKLKLSRIRKGISSAAIAFAVWYALINGHYRTSRVILLSTIVIASLVTLVLRSGLKWIKTGSPNLFRSNKRIIAVIASKEEQKRVSDLFRPLNVEADIVGRISPQGDQDPGSLGSINDLEDIIAAKRINTLVFCSKDVSSETTMSWMTILSDKLEFKVLPQKSDSIIGSASRNMPGELYTIDMQYSISRPENIRAKRIFDLISAFFLVLVLIPLLLITKYRMIWKQSFHVMVGKKSWLGYFEPSSQSLPSIKTGVWSKGDEPSCINSDQQRINFLYARDYKWMNDLEYLLRKLL